MAIQQDSNPPRASARSHKGKHKIQRPSIDALSEKLGCPVVETVSISSDGLKNVVDAAVSNVGKVQKAPFVQKGVDLTDKEAVKEADKKRFEKVFTQGVMTNIEIWLDRETGVNYLFYQNGNAGGFTPLLDKDGKVVITPVEEE